MAAYEIELILNRQLADCLSIPVFYYGYHRESYFQQ
jgi:hypothetical protein